MEQKTLEKKHQNSNKNNIIKESNKEIPESINPKDPKNNNQSDIVDFYLQPEFIKMISQQIANQPHVDQTKIEKIKEALKNKNLNFDDLSLAEKMIELETGFFTNKKDRQ